MMDAAWAALLAKYGQRVVLHQGNSTVDARAFLQPIREKGCLLYTSDAADE